MLTVTRAWAQSGWTGTDHLLDHSGMTAMAGQTYRDLRGLSSAARGACDPRSYPMVEYHDGIRRYRYDGSPDGIPGRHVARVTDLGPLAEECPATLVTTIPQVDGGLREIYAQDAEHAQRARALLRRDPAMIDRLGGVDGIRITVRDRA